MISTAEKAITNLPSLAAVPPPSLHWVFGRDQMESLRVVLNHVSEAILLLDAENRIQMVNPFGEQLFDENREQLIGKKWTDYLVPAHAADLEHPLLEDIDRASCVDIHGPKEVLLRRHDGVILDVDLSLSSIPAEQPLYVCVMRDLTPYKQEKHELRQLARTDYLTQIANRRAFDEVLQRQWSDCRASGLPLSVILIDIDHFKRFNDQYGHLQGDLCLRRIAQTIQSTLPSPRLLAARFGGEEFGVVLPGYSEAQALELAEKLRFSVAELRFRHEGITPPVSLSISLGVACDNKESLRNQHALLDVADIALYRAKLSGRNRAVSGKLC